MDNQERERFLRYLALGVAEDESTVSSPKNPEFEKKHPRGNPKHKGQFRKSEKTLAKLDEADASVSTPAWQREYDEIVAKYKGTDEWMKAPNGKPTNLTERQWVQVRTPSFKAWFGDWENKDADFSVVMDRETEEPLVVYHGTCQAGFKAFDNPESPTGSGDGTFWFVDDREAANRFAGSHEDVDFSRQDQTRAVYPVFLNIRRDDVEYEDFHGAHYDGSTGGKFEAMAYNDELYENYDGISYFRSEEDLRNSLADEGRDPDDYEIREAGYDVGLDSRDFGIEVADDTNPDAALILDNVVDTKLSDGCVDRYGYDRPVTEFILKNPKNIKSATCNSGEFSPEKETVMDSKLDLKKIAQMAIAEDAVADGTTLDVVLEVLKQEGDNPRRSPYPKTRLVPPLPKSSAQDAAPDDESPTSMASDLQKHDKRFHPQGYKEGDSCKYRETLAQGDKSDAALAAAETAESRGNIPKKKHAEYLRLMQKKHPELDAMAVLAEVGKIGDKKIQGDAFSWVLRGAVRLPEDLYKVEQARNLATKAKVDPLSYNTPQACINDLLGKGHKVSLKPITVEELKKDPLFSDYQKLPEGVESFEVEDSREGQRRMREVLDTHWGKDANPWCLLARKGKESWERSNDREEYEKSEEWWRSQTPPEREEIAAKIFKKDTSRDIIDDFVNCESIVDADGAEDYYYKNVAEPVDDLENAWDYWNRYNALPKRVAFKDGKLLAFMATDPLDDDSAFDDAAYGGGSRLAEMYPDEYEEYEKWEESEEGQNEGANFYEWLQHEYPELTTDDALHDNVPEQWWDRQDSPHKGIPVGNMAVPGDKFGRWADMMVKDGQVKIDPSTTDTWHKGDRDTEGHISWWDNGQIQTQVKDGKTQGFYPDGALSRVEEDDLTAKFYRNGGLKYVTNFGGGHSVKEPLEIDLDEDGNIVGGSILWKGKDGELPNRARFSLNNEGRFDFMGDAIDEKKFLSKVNALVSEAKRRFPNGGKTTKAPSKDTAAFPEKAFQKWLEKQD